MESTILMDMLFSDETPDAKKDAISQKITEAVNTGSSQLKDGDQDLTLVKQGDNLVKIQDNKSGESTLAKCNSDGSHDLVAEKEVNPENKTFSDMNYNETEYCDYEMEPQERLFTEAEVEQEVAEVRYFSELEAGVDKIFSNIESLEERDYEFSDLEDAYQDLEVLYSELSDLHEMGHDVMDAMDATIAYSEYLEDLADQELWFSETVGELADAADEVKDNLAELIENPTQENKEIVKDKVDELHDVAKEYSDVIDTYDLVDEMAYFSEVIDEVMTFSDVDALRSDVDELHQAAHEEHPEDDPDEVTQKVKALSEEARAYAEIAEEQGHDVEDIHEKLDDIDAKLDGLAVEQVKQGIENKSFSTTYVDSYLTTPIR